MHDNKGTQFALRTDAASGKVVCIETAPDEMWAKSCVDLYQRQWLSGTVMRYVISSRKE